jgi:exonuclease SbcC
VRPLELKLKGLRSYHGERTIPLAEESLLAIVGDTGAGKSSLLEAIVFALYAGSSWDGRAASELISDRTRTMVVELTFRAQGEAWRVRRTMSNSNRPAEHELVCTSDPDKPRADGAHAVNREVKRLVGLDREQFCRAVLLPQGRFEQLLHATPGERVDVLKGLLGLDQVTRVRDQAAKLQRTLSDRLLEISDRRGQFLPDPRAVADRARKRIAEIEPEALRFEEVQRGIGKAEQDAQAREAQAATFEQKADTLEPRMVGDAATLGRLDEIERGIAERRRPLAEELESHDRRIQQSTERIETIKRERRDRENLERGIDALVEAHSRLESLDRDQTTLDEQLTEAERQRAALAEAQERLPALETELNEASAAAKDATSQLSLEDQRQRQFAEALTELASQLDQHRAAEHSLKDNASTIESAVAVEQLRQEELDSATTARGRAEDEHDRLTALAPVATLAHDCRAGDACPVCARELPEDFEPPSVDGLDSAKSAYVEAQEAERQAAKTHAEATAALKHLRDASPALEHALDGTRKSLGSAEGTVRGLTESLDRFDGTDLLARARAQAETADQKLGELREIERAKQAARDERKDARDKLLNGIESDRKLLENKDGANQREQKRIADDRAQVHQRVSKLPLPLEIPGAPTATRLADTLDELRELLPAAQQLEAEHDQLLAERQELGQKLGELDKQLQSDVREPAIAARTSLDGLRMELERLGTPGLPNQPEARATIPELVAWGEAIEKAVVDELQNLRTQAETLRGEATTTRDTALAQLAELGVEGREEFEKRHISLRSDLRLARRDLDQAEEQLDPVAKLDDLRKGTEAMCTAFADLYDLLLDSNFIKYAVENRQRVLLAAASLVLQEVTSGHYGLAEDFRIVDNETGQARAARTLSGGESFLASLSLALGLVEATARSGGRLDALFLDEGFGSLDPNALQQSLNALERRAEAGRLVAVISHVPLVAEQIERVLHVTKDHEGSHVRFMTASERAEMAFADVTENGA